MKIFATVALVLGFNLMISQAQRTPVLPQIDLPHNYYYRGLYLPQLTSGPSAVSWSPDGKELVFSMAGTLWRKELGTKNARQLTDGDGYDYQPDWSPDGSKVIFVRYNGNSIELMLLDLASGKTIALTSNNGVNLEPRWSPDGKQIVFVSTNASGHFLLYTASVADNSLKNIFCLTPDRKSVTKRYYYSVFDGSVNPTWSRDGKQIFFVSNREEPHGTGNMVVINASGGDPKIIHHEETSWQTKPDVSPDGARIVYSSYLGRSWHQLWLVPTIGGNAIQLTYGDYDNTSPRWSPDGKKIAFISNRQGNTSLWTTEVFDGRQTREEIDQKIFINSGTSLSLKVEDENGEQVYCRISITDSRGKFFAPEDSWIQADDARFKGQKYESHYFLSDGSVRVDVPLDQLSIKVSHGFEYEISKMQVDTRTSAQSITIRLKKLDTPSSYGKWWSGDVHVHMNYGGPYRNTPANLVRQAQSENLNFVYNLIVNKEQRIMDQSYFSSLPDPASSKQVMLLHGEEFHTSFWGHLGLLGLDDHLIVPVYSAYPQTAVQSLFPNNSFIADRVHEQSGLVGYVHPFEPAEIFPDQSPALSNELPVDAALGKVDYYELMGFAEHKASETVWYKLLNCGIRLPAAGGTDAMANYSSLRGPVGLNRVYVKAEGSIDNKIFQENLKHGRSYVSNGPIIGFNIGTAGPGDSLSMTKSTTKLAYSGFVRSAIPVEHVEIVFNGEVIKTHSMKSPSKSFDIGGNISVSGPGWVLLRAWSSTPDPDLLDMYVYASTNPVYLTSPGKQIRSKASGEFFVKWLDRLESITSANTSFRTDEEKQIILNDIRKARNVYEKCIREATIR